MNNFLCITELMTNKGVLPVKNIINMIENNEDITCLSVDLKNEKIRESRIKKYTLLKKEKYIFQLYFNKLKNIIICNDTKLVYNKNGDSDSFYNIREYHNNLFLYYNNEYKKLSKTFMTGYKDTHINSLFDNKKVGIYTHNQINLEYNTYEIEFEFDNILSKDNLIFK